MGFFERLRKRLLRRRVERKLLQLSQPPSRAREPKDLIASRLQIKPLGTSGATVLSVDPQSCTKASGVGSNQVACSGADQESLDNTASLDKALGRYVTTYNAQSRQDFQRERNTLWELQEYVPTIRPLISQWIEWHKRSQDVVLRSTRDVERWKAFQEKTQAELFCIHDHIVKAMATKQRDRKLTAQRIHTSALHELSPEVLIGVAMVSAAIVAGLYGLLILAAILKYQKRI